MFRSLRQKILAGYVVLVLMLALVGVWSVYNFMRLSDAMLGITDRNYRSIVAAQHMTVALERDDSAQLMLLLGEGARAQEIHGAAQADFLAWYSRAADNITEPGEANIIRDLHAGYSAYSALFPRLLALMVAGRSDEARRLYLTDADPAFKQVRALVASLQNLNNSAFLAGNVDARANALQATWSTIAVGSAAVFLGLFLGYNLSEAIVRPTVRLTETVRRIAEGNLREKIEVAGRDEISQLASEFNEMVARLRAFQETKLGQLLTERRKSDTIVRVMADPVVAVDDRYRILLLNPAAEAVFGVDEHLVQGRPFLQVINRPDIYGRLERAVAGPPPDPDVELPPVAIRQRFFDVEVVTLEGPDDRLAGLVAVLRDVTRFKELDDLKSEFVSTVSHEFRTPLTTMAMGTALLARHPALAPGTREAEMLAAMAEETDRLTRLVNDLLDLARLEAGRIQFDLHPVPLRHLLEHAANALQPQADEKGITLTARADPEDLQVRVDPDQVLLVLTNLLGNALRYTPPGGSVSVAAVARAGRALVAVADTGPGIPPAMQKRVFEKFFQVSGRPRGGAGLGLAICREVVRAHGGRIWVHSQEGKGATFFFTLPLADPRAKKIVDMEASGDAPGTDSGGR